MLYTVIAPQSVWRDEIDSPQCTLQRVQHGDVQILVDDEGVVKNVLSSDPAVFLRINARYPFGRIR